MSDENFQVRTILKYLSKCIFSNVAGIRTRLLKSSGNCFLKSLATSKASTNMLLPPSTSGSYLSIDKWYNVSAITYWIHHGDSTWWQGMRQDLYPKWYQPLHYPPSPWNWVVPHHWCLRPLLFQRTAVWVLFTSKNNHNHEELWDRYYSLSSLSKKTRMSNHLKMSQ